MTVQKLRELFKENPFLIAVAVSGDKIDTVWMIEPNQERKEKVESKIKSLLGVQGGNINITTEEMK